ncbi:MAG: hypothetical protein ABS44_21715 [Chryseobacterium sp. SCN 40-13]|nr:MAG: hypothetical protein ABS44_21715 [Chryseobacterium sp. SCN 40-13]
MRPRVDVTPFEEMLSDEIRPETLKDKLAEIRYNYTRYALKDEDACGGQPDKADDAYWLKMLEERLTEIIERQSSAGSD